MEERPGVFLLCHKFLMIKKDKKIENLLLKLKIAGLNNIFRFISANQV